MYTFPLESFASWLADVPEPLINCSVEVVFIVASCFIHSTTGADRGVVGIVYEVVAVTLEPEGTDELAAFTVAVYAVPVANPVKEVKGAVTVRVTGFTPSVKVTI